MHCWRNVMAHKPWITAEFVTVCCSMSVVSKTVMSWFSHTYECRLCMDLPYSGKLSREKTFANFAFLWLYAKVFSAKFGVWRHLALQKWAIHKSFLRENRIFTNSRKFSPSKVFCYTVPEVNSTTMRDLHCLWAACSCLSWSAVAVRALTSAVFVPWVSFTPTLYSGNSPSRARQWTVHIARTKLHSVFMKYLNAFI